MGEKETRFLVPIEFWIDSKLQKRMADMKMNRQEFIVEAIDKLLKEKGF